MLNLTSIDIITRNFYSRRTPRGQVFSISLILKNIFECVRIYFSNRYLLENEHNCRCLRENFSQKKYRYVLSQKIIHILVEAIHSAIADKIMNSSLPRDHILLSLYTYAPIVSDDVERSVSEYNMSYLIIDTTTFKII